MLADPEKTRKKLGWNPKINFKDLVKIMVDYDMEFAGLDSIGEGIKIVNDKGIHWTSNKLTVRG